MKKRLVTILTILSTASAIWADPIDLAKAKRIATAYMSEGTTPEAVTSEVKTRNTTTANAPLYIFNRGNDQGFVIVSGDDCMPEILGYTEKGDFNPQELPPALLEWIEEYSTMIEKAQEVNAPARIVTRATTVKQDIAPLVTAHWNQGTPYNNLCPYRTDGGGRAVTGCVATAASQIVYYWRKENPAKTLYDTPTYSYGDAPVTESIPAGTPIKYALMQDTYTGSTPEDMNTAVATLMSVVGTSTYLTYGSSTSGQISNLVNTFWGQFHLNSICTYKSGYTQTAWENLIYEDLEKGWPIVYSGVHPTSGGHAVVVDGYRAADNLFHFNFGWGGGGDGYFTVNDTNGMNGFNEQQGMTHQIHPNVNLLTATLKPIQLCTRVNNPIEYEVANNGTVDYSSGLYLYASKNEGEPTSISSANGKDLTTVIPTGESRSITINYRPVTEGTYHVYLMDGNAQILAHTTMEAVAQISMLSLEDLGVKNSIPVEREVTLDGQPTTLTCHNIYGDLAEVVATISNPEEATNIMPGITGIFYAYEEEQSEFTELKKIVRTTQIFKKGELTDLIFSADGLTEDKLYALGVVKTYRTAAVDYTMNLNVNDTIVYFSIQNCDLAMTETQDGGAVLTGHWNADKFKELTQDATYTYYDLTAVEAVNSQPEAGNPNALFYLNENTGVKGYNIIKNGVCERLQLTYGSSFKPKENFTALQVSFDTQATPLKWSYIALPFDCDVPNGSMARRIRKLTNTLISGADIANTRMESGIPYLYKSTRTGTSMLTAENVEISAAPKEFSDTLKATFMSIIGTEGTIKLNQDETQQFTSAKNFTIPAFSGYMNYAQNAEADASIYWAQDEVANQLATALNAAYEAEEKYEGKVPAEVWESFIETLNDAASSYTQQTSTDDMENMTTALTESLNTVACNEIFSGEPIDLTSYYLENPSFEKKRTTGWTLTRASGQTSKVQSISTLEEYTVNADGEYVFYTYSTTGKGSVGIKQSVSGIPNGYYRLTAKIGTDEGQSVTLYAGDKTATMTDDGFGLRYLTEVAVDGIRVENGTLEIGINGTEYAYKADDFRLYYIGGLETAITSTQADARSLKAWGGEGLINLFSAEDAPVAVSIYGTDGRLYQRLTVTGFRQVSNLPKGIYIVNRQKVMVK